MILQGELGDTGTLAVIVIVSIVLMYAIVYGAKWQAEKGRAKALAEVAQDLGLRFDAVHDHDHCGKYDQFAMFDRACTRFAKNSLRGKLQLFGQDCELLVGDYRAYSRHTNLKFSYLIVHLPRNTPNLLIRPEGVLDKVKAAIGIRDVQLGDEEFDRKFHVQSLDEPFARQLLSRDMMQFLQREQPPLLHIDRDTLLLTDGRRRWQPEEFARRIEFVERFCGLWPERR